MDYSIDNLPRQIARSPTSAFGTPPNAATIPAPNNLTQFHYGADNQRTLQVLSFDATKKRSTVYAGGYERDTYSDGRVEQRYTLASGVMLIKSTVATRDGTYYTHSDRLGSTSTVTKSDGSLVSQNGFDAFGMPRDGDWKLPSWGWTMFPTASGAGYTNPGITRRGFTDHEQLDQLGLTHMNGRMYDYRLGRFLGVDPIIQFPTNSQSLNPYSYLMNNPLSGTDPTGYYSECGGNEMCQRMKQAEFLAGPLAAFKRGAEWEKGNGARGRQGSGDTKKEPKGTVDVGDPKRETAYATEPSNVPFHFNMLKNIARTTDTTQGKMGSSILFGIPEDGAGAYAHWFTDSDQDTDGVSYTQNPLNGEWQGPWRGRFATLFTVLNLASAGEASGITNLAKMGRGAGPTLFRGTTEGYLGSPGLQRIRVTPASTDPNIATIFATESANHGNAVVHIASPHALRGATIAPGNVLASIEREVAVLMSPSEFAARGQTILAAQSRSILQYLGIRVPGIIADKAALDSALRAAAPMTPSQTQAYIKAAEALQ
jgi:RHS repeat-associated protein